ncbi:MAG: DUF4836 family protein [Ginsengibacter sp.]
MKSLIKLSVLLSVFILLFSSCGKNNEAGKMIPSDALFVAQVNMKSLGNKLSWEDIKKTSWYQKAYSDSTTPDWRRKIFDNPSASGIDFEEGITFFIAKNLGTEYFAVEGDLKSVKDFEQFNKNFNPSRTPSKQGKINVMVLKDNNVVGWNDDHFVYVMSPQTTFTRLYKDNDSSNIQNNNSPADKSTELSSICANLFSLKSDSSLTRNDRFATLLKETGDVHLWQNTEAIIKSSSAMGMLGMMKLDAFTKNNVSTYTINFDKGRIDVDQKTYASKDLTDIVKKYMSNSINMDMIKNIPSQNVLGVLAFNFKPEGIIELIKLTGADGILNSYAQQMGFTLDDFSKATNGDWVLAFSDLKMNPDMSKPEINYIFSAGIGNKANLQKIMEVIKKTTSEMGKDSAINYVMNDKLIALGSSNSFAKQYLSGGNYKYDFSDKISGHPVGFFFDIHRLLTEFSTIKMDRPDKKEILDKSLNTWNNIIASGGEFKKDAFTFHAEINLINKDSNSLKLLSNYMDDIYRINEAKKERSTAKLDSLLVPPPIDTVNVK